MHPWAALRAALTGVGLLIQCISEAHSTQRNPLSSATWLEDAVIVTPSHRVHAFSTFDLTFLLPDRHERVKLSLAPNHDILSADASVRIINADGSVQSVEPIDRSEHKIFRGHAFLQGQESSEWRSVGWARINVHQDGAGPIFEGTFSVGNDHHHVQTSMNYRQTMVEGDPEMLGNTGEDLVVWRDSEIKGYADDSPELRRDIEAAQGCSSDELVYNRDETNMVYRSMGEATTPVIEARSLFVRQIDGTTGSNGAGVNLVGTIGSTQGCPTTKKVALVGIAADCNYVSQFGSAEKVRSNIISLVNSASQLYESTFKISLGIQNLTLSNNMTCPTTAPPSAPWNIPCSDSVTITDRLNLFSAWRGLSKDTNAYWTLLSTCNTGAAVGLAWLGEVCKVGSQSVTQGSTNETIAGANVVVRTSQEWQVFAHEAGHTFGAVHDCTSNTCSDGTSTKQQCCPLSSGTCNAGGGYMMNPSTGPSITKFSPCSIGNICSFLGRANPACLASNKDVVTITGSQCGNGIVESGEDCDCGGEAGCGSNPCCNPTTCKFTAGSVCDPANEECCSPTCKFSSAGTVCRPSTGGCDPQEVCMGNTGICPADKYAQDGLACGAGGGLACASGQCTSRNLQCKVMMGSLTSDNDTYSCSSQGCLLSCASPEFGPNTCYTMQQNFLDGTPCQGGGKCRSGACSGATIGNEIGEVFNANKKWIIPVACVVGGLLLIALVSCILNCCRRGASRRRAPVKRFAQGMGQGPPRGVPPPPPPPAYGVPQPPPAWAAPGRQSRPGFRYA